MQCETLDPKHRSQVKEEICCLGEAVTFFPHECPGFSKASMLWAQGLLHLLLLFYFQDGSQTSFAESIRQKLRCFQVHPRNYTWTRFQAQNAVYMKTTVDWRHFSSVEHYRQPSTFMYIGSTSQSVFRRESNRMSVAKKLTSGKEAQAELSIRFWVSNKSLQTYTLFLVTPCSSYREAWVTEHCLIGMWQPKLNHPYIISFLKRSALGFRPNKRVRLSAFSRFGMRLWRKLRKKLHTQNQPEVFQLKRRSAWEILFNLTCFSRAPFEEIKRLRSDRYVPDEIYSLIRLSNSLEEPGKTKARNALKSVCKYRNMSRPRSALGLRLKFTADPSFGMEISKWIRSQVLLRKQILIPFHLPVFKVREQPHQSLKDFLHSFKDWDSWLQDNPLDQVPCPCHKYIHMLPQVCITQGHVVSGIEHLGVLHHSFNKLGAGSASSAFFPAKHEFFKRNLKMFSAWRRKHHLPLRLESEFQDILQEQWARHIKCLRADPRLTWKDVSVARALLRKDFVVHCEDHEPNHLMIFCPRFYFQSALRTWQDPEVFESVSGSRDQWNQWVLDEIPDRLRSRYKWGINANGTLPVGFAFLKRKKSFLKGRTIISYSNSCVKELLKAASQAILLMIRLVWPEAMGMATTPRLWKSLKYLHVSDLESIVSVSFKAGVFTTLGLMFRQHRGTCVGNQISPVLSSLPVIQRESYWQREWAQFLTSARFFDTQQAELFICRYVDDRLLGDNPA